MPKQLFTAVCLLLLCACTATTRPVQPGARPPAITELEPQSETALAVAVSSSSADGEMRNQAEAQQIQAAMAQLATTRLGHRLEAGDLLDIEIYQETEMNRTVRISGDGSIAIPLAGSVKVAGLSVPQAEDAIVLRLARYIINPQVNILVREYGNKTVYVLGEVTKPGALELPAEQQLTLVGAITMAGGFTQIAAQDRTKVLRSVNGKNQVFQIEVSRITKEGDKTADIALEPNDIIIVPQSFF